MSGDVRQRRVVVRITHQVSTVGLGKRFGMLTGFANEGFVSDYGRAGYLYELLEFLRAQAVRVTVRRE